jgi:hypothetical protein
MRIQMSKPYVPPGKFAFLISLGNPTLLKQTHFTGVYWSVGTYKFPNDDPSYVPTEDDPADLKTTVDRRVVIQRS